MGNRAGALATVHEVATASFGKRVLTMTPKEKEVTVPGTLKLQVLADEVAPAARIPSYW